MKLLFIRHRQTDWNVKGMIQGSHDIELNDVGIHQAESLSQTLLQQKLTFIKIFSSPQKRAVQTAEILSKATHVDYEVLHGLEEINLGEWEGLTWNEVKSRYPLEYKNWYLNRRYTKVPGGESFQDMLDRVLVVIDRITKENTDDVLIVTHNAVIMCLLCLITNTPFEEMIKFKTENASIIEIDYADIPCES